MPISYLIHSTKVVDTGYAAANIHLHKVYCNWLYKKNCSLNLGELAHGFLVSLWI